MFPNKRGSPVGTSKRSAEYLGTLGKQYAASSKKERGVILGEQGWRQTFYYNSRPKLRRLAVHVGTLFLQYHVDSRKEFSGNGADDCVMVLLLSLFSIA